MNTPDDLRRALEALPDPPPPDALWAQLRTRRQAQLRRRRAAAVLASGGMGIVLCLALLPSSPRHAPDPVATNAAPATTDTPRIDERVRALDRALQAGYDRGASDAELAPMWEARHALLAHSELPRGRPGDTNEI